MKSIILAVVSVVAVSAQAKSFTPRYTCAEAQAEVRSKGAAVIYTSENEYDRYVVSQTYCARGEVTKAAWISTSDSNACFVGYVCVAPQGRR